MVSELTCTVMVFHELRGGTYTGKHLSRINAAMADSIVISKSTDLSKLAI